MNSVDMVIATVAVVFGVLGLYWGVIRQVLSFVGLIAGIAFATRYGSEIGDWLSSFVDNLPLANVIGFVIVLAAVSSIASLLASLLRRFVGLLFLGFVDHLLGGVLGLLQGLLACMVVLALASTLAIPAWQESLAESQIAPLLMRGFSFVIPLLPESVQFATQWFLQR